MVLAAKCKKKYANAHVYHVNSIAMSSDQETFITADDLRINLWHLDIEDQAFNVVDMKPPNMEELTEVGRSFLLRNTRDRPAGKREEELCAALCRPLQAVAACQYAASGAGALISVWSRCASPQAQR